MSYRSMREGGTVSYNKDNIFGTDARRRALKGQFGIHFHWPTKSQWMILVIMDYIRVAIFNVQYDSSCQTCCVSDPCVQNWAVDLSVLAMSSGSAVTCQSSNGYFGYRMEIEVSLLISFARVGLLIGPEESESYAVVSYARVT